MATLNDLRGRVWSRFMSPAVVPEAPEPALLADGAAPAGEPRRRFSVFRPGDLERAIEVTAELMRRADAAPDVTTGLGRVLDFEEELRGQGTDPDLVDHALQIFLTHHPRGRLLAPAMPRLSVRRPEQVAPSTGRARPVELRESGEVALELLADSALAGGALPAPDGLEWFREDPFANEHHIHWHVVYPTSGIPDPANPGRRLLKDRQGELFFYMHRQMLARYDAERRALGLAPVDSYADYRASIALGYDPGELLRASYGPRPPGRTMVASPGYTLGDHETRRDRLGAAVTAGEFRTSPARPVTSDLLGATIEANSLGVHGLRPAPTAFYGNLHNVGHGLIADASEDLAGVMTDPATAIRDPAFWRWHRHIDDFYAAWQQELGPRGFDDRPLVRMRKGFDPASGAAGSPDVLFLFDEALPPEAAADLPAWAAERYGGAHWDDDPAADPLLSDELETWMATRTLTLSDRRTSVDLTQLVHRPFVTVYRVENPLDRDYRLTLRTFIVPREATGDRHAWIELDKFTAELPAGARGVFVRHGSQSVVLRKPAEMLPELLKESAYELDAATLDALAAGGLSAATVERLRELEGRLFVANRVEIDELVAELRARIPAAERDLGFQLVQRHAFRPGEQPAPPPPDAGVDEAEAMLRANYCTCGWPYNLLLPRGRPDGQVYRLAVIATDADLDQAGGSETCGSLSFCGARDRYPDQLDMGYPFDRPFTDGVLDTFLALGNAAVRDFTLRRLPDVDGIP